MGSCGNCVVRQQKASFGKDAGNGALRIGYHAPPPGAPTGVADYASTLLKALRSLAPPNFTFECNARHADLNLYHLGNNRLHAGIYARSLVTPGVVILHDAVLHHFLLGELSPAAYSDEFVYNYGEWNRHVGEELWRERSACAVDPRFFRYPMLRRAVENARAVVVHNAGAAAIAREHGAGAIHVIPHFFEPGEISDAAMKERFRQDLGIAPGVTLFGIFGYLRETKRIVPCIGAFRRLHAVRPQTAVLIAGEVVSGDLRRLLESESAHPAIHRLGHLPEADFPTAAAAIDCCINLRYPAAGETSGIAIRLMGIGKPVIVTDGPETADIPLSACLHVPSGVDEAAGLFDQMALMAGFPDIARRVGAVAESYIRNHHDLQKAARAYLQVIDSVMNSAAGLT
jgi:glycosyltransferase involved in cell wall biosynthesis